MTAGIGETASAPRPSIHVEAFSASLQDRALGGSVGFPEPSWRLIYIQNGILNFRTEEEHIELQGPSLSWIPWTKVYRLSAKAGSVGAAILLNETMLANAIGHKPESADLRLMVQNRAHFAFQDNAVLEPEARVPFEVIMREFRTNAPAADTVIEAQVRVLLVIIWRSLLTSGASVPNRSDAGQALQAFRQLVELNFRMRWRVVDYAEELGMTRDRLHDICVRNIGKSPHQLLRERTIAEAEALLLRSNRTIDQISDFLGFQSASHFSRFFRNANGVPPGAYRRSLLGQAGFSEVPTGKNYADWP